VRPDPSSTLLLLLLSTVACGEAGTPSSETVPPATDPREAVLALLQAAQTGRTSGSEIRFLVPADQDRKQWLVLAELLASLGSTHRATLVKDEPLGADRFAVDVAVELPGGGSARYSAQAVRQSDGRFVVVSLAGPRGSWPRVPTPTDSGLSVSGTPVPDPPLRP
jgi:hypothetical protein